MPREVGMSWDSVAVEEEDLPRCHLRTPQPEAPPQGRPATKEALYRTAYNPS